MCSLSRLYILTSHFLLVAERVLILCRCAVPSFYLNNNDVWLFYRSVMLFRNVNASRTHTIRK